MLQEIEWIVRMPRYKTKEDSVDIVKVSCEGVEPTKSRTWTQSVSVPQMPHVDLEACSIINVKFLLKVRHVDDMEVLSVFAYYSFLLFVICF